MFNQYTYFALLAAKFFGLQDLWSSQNVFGPPTAGCVVVDFKDREVCYVKFWWLLFLALKFTFLFLNLAKIQIFIPKCTEGEGPLV